MSDYLLINKQNCAVRKELSGYSYKTLNTFVEMFPCEIHNSIIEIMEITTSSVIDIDNVFYLDIDTYEKFWINWNRFKKILAFI